MLISDQRLIDAANLIKKEYPFERIGRESRTYTPRQMIRIFIRDGFIDQYRGHKLIFPPVLRILSNLLPEVFPYHKNGKMDEGHIAYWELFPTIDHRHPISRGGKDEEQNWVCCSMLTNSIKSNWTLEEIGWIQSGFPKDPAWDGMLRWCLTEIKKEPKYLEIPYVKTWCNAAIDVLSEQ